MALDGTPTSIKRGTLDYALVLTPIELGNGIAIDVADMPARDIGRLLAARSGVRIEGVEHLSDLPVSLRAEGAPPKFLLEMITKFDDVRIVERNGALVIEPAEAEDARN